MNVKLNGQDAVVSENSNLEDFLKTIELPSMYAVEINENLVYKEEYSKIKLNENDTIEIVMFTGGG